MRGLVCRMPKRSVGARATRRPDDQDAPPTAKTRSFKHERGIWGIPPPKKLMPSIYLNINKIN